MSHPDTRRADLDVAIIGLAGRFPRARNVARFWEHLRNGDECLTFFADDVLLAAGTTPEMLANPRFVKGGKGLLDDVELFDAAFFGFSPSEAEVTDPQQRIFLECAWEALENAGYAPESCSGRIGVFGGMNWSQYLVNLFSDPAVRRSLNNHLFGLGTDKDYLATKVAYRLNLCGPSLTIQTACSTSLVAVHVACQSVLNGECDMALAGGAALMLPRIGGYVYQPDGTLSPDGHCRAFDERASGMVPGDGVALVVVKRLNDALRDGDAIRAVIRGSAINNDGSRKVGYTAPSVEGQVDVLTEALAIAGVDPDTIGYVEAHGTGTSVGDPIEVRALTQVYRRYTDRVGYCWLGSVKTNIGHLDSAAGVAGLIKATLCVQHGEIPGSLNFETPHPSLHLDTSPFRVPTKLTAWPPAAHPRRAAVSSFGIGGTNAHVVLEQPPDVTPADPPARQFTIVPLSARSTTALANQRLALAHHLRAQAGDDLADVAYTLQVGRRPFLHRSAVVCRAGDDLIGQLLAEGAPTARAGANPPRVAFLFPGGGSQYVRMGHDLYQSESVFRDEADRLLQRLAERHRLDLRPILYPTDAVNGADLSQMVMLQLSLFVIEYALARLWMHWGVQPSAVLGHSTGEYTAAAVAGAIDAEQALDLLVQRGRLTEGLQPGAMISAAVSEQEAEGWLRDGVSLAAVNAPRLCVFSGETQAITALEGQLAAAGRSPRRLQVSHAAHSWMLDPILDEFAPIAARVRLRPPTIPYVSSVTGEWLDAAHAGPDYWVRHLRQPVRFADGLRRLVSEPNTILIEVGPGTTLRSVAAAQTDCRVLTSMPFPHEARGGTQTMLQTLAELWMIGLDVNWPAFHQGERRLRVPLPTYPFEGSRYWVERRTGGASPIPRRETGADPTASLYRPTWKDAGEARPTPPAPDSVWMILADGSALGAHVSALLTQRDIDLVEVFPGDTYRQVSGRHFEIRPTVVDDYRRVLRHLGETQRAPSHVVHCWAVGASAEETETLSSAAFFAAQERGFGSVTCLLQALGLDPDPLRVTVVTSNVHDVLGRGDLAVHHATISGLAQAVPPEYPRVTFRHVDAEFSRGEHDVAGLAGLLVNELLTDMPLSLALCAGKRWMRDFEQVSADTIPNQPLPLRPDGAYLITGGFGGIGLELATFIAERTESARIVLSGRRALPGRERWPAILDGRDVLDPDLLRVVRRIVQLEARGCRVVPLTADLTSPALHEVLADCVRQVGPFDGVVHAAGAPDSGLIHAMTRDRVARAVAGKVVGLLNLLTFLDVRDLDFLVSCSSLASLVGGLGFADYAAANAWLDAFAFQQASRGARMTAINWDGWNQTGMARSVATAGDQSAFMPVEEGIRTFGLALRAGEPQVAVAMRDIDAIRREEAARRLRPAAAAAAPSVAKHPRPDLSTLYVEPRNDVEARLASVWADLLGVQTIGVHDNLFELGAQSLLALQALERIEAVFGRGLELAVFYHTPTVAGMATALAPASTASALALPVGPAGRHGSLVPIQPEGDQRPLYLVHAIGGDIFGYYELARALPHDQPVFGLQASGLFDDADPSCSIPEMAARYLEAIQSHNPRGPYRFGGWSLGAVIAWEMAAQALQHGREVDEVVVLDMFAPEPSLFGEHHVDDDASILAALVRKVELLSGASIPLSEHELRTLDPAERLSRVAAAIRPESVHNLSPEYMRRLVAVYRASDLALYEYTPASLHVNVTIFQAEELLLLEEEASSHAALLRRRQEPAMGWLGLSSGTVKVLSVPGNHITMMAHPHIVTLADRLASALAGSADPAGVSAAG